MGLDPNSLPANLRRAMLRPATLRCKTDTCATAAHEVVNNIMPQTFTCLNCGASFQAFPSQERKYCSTTCAYASADRVKHVKPKDRGTATCLKCSKVFRITTRSGKAKYCSRNCAASDIGSQTIIANQRYRPKQALIAIACKTCGKKFDAWKSSKRIYCSSKCSAGDSEMTDRRLKSYRANGNKFNIYSRCPKGWLEIGGKRIFCKSTWEAKYARYLDWLIGLEEIAGWQYEPQTFWFEGIKRGVRSYLPDFKVVHNNGSHEWHEVKGWMDAKSKTKIKRMKKYHPSETVRIIDGTWFKSMSSKLSGLVPEWNAPFGTSASKSGRKKSGTSKTKKPSSK
jgi:endogenous inhibitor of DNA gyrase (YacG/DUF329 family)